MGWCYNRYKLLLIFPNLGLNTFILAKRAYALRVSGKCGDFVAVTMHALKGSEVLFVAFHFDSYMAAPR